jgi:hypothetical protein
MSQSKQYPHSAQLTLFGSTVSSTSVLELAVRLPRPCWCGSAVATIGSSAGPHHGRLRCAGCETHRGWLSRESYEFIAAVIDEFGRPDQPITIRFKNSRTNANDPL